MGSILLKGEMRMRSIDKKQNVSIYQFKVTLKGINPPIWRRIQVTSDTGLSKLHYILQIVMGWTDSHLHQFVIGQTYYGIPDMEDFREVKNEIRYKISQVAPREKMKFLYEYDFGDGWEHEIIVEKILQAVPGVHYPLCLAGKRACPPEDCGGIYGYADLLEAIMDPANSEHRAMMDWIGGDFEPEAFDLDAINQILRNIR